VIKTNGSNNMHINN